MGSKRSWLFAALMALSAGWPARAGEVVVTNGPPPVLKAPEDIVTEVILDASGSMKQKVHQRTKLFQAKRVLRAFMEQSGDENLKLGFRAFGLKEKDCKSSKLVYDFGKEGPGGIDSAMEQVNPEGYGKTPLEYSLREAAKDLEKYKGKPRRIVLVSDGIDTCGGDPCKAAKELARKLDIRIYVVGYGLDPDEREKLRCLAGDGNIFDENDLMGLLNALKKLDPKKKNLIVKSPEPMGTSELFEVLPGGKLKKAGKFVSEFGTTVETNKEYEVHVLLDPIYKFQHVVVLPGEVKVLVVKGTGRVNIQFRDQLFAVTLLDDKGTPVMSFPSDTPTEVKSGFYKVRAVSPPFAEAVIDDIQVVPGGVYDEKIRGFGTIEIVPPKERAPLPYGYYVFDDIKKLDLGSYITGTPLVLPDSRYLIKTVGNGILKNVYPSLKDPLRIPIPPPGQTVTFARREKPDPNEPKGPAFLHDMSADQIQKHLKALETQSVGAPKAP